MDTIKINRGNTKLIAHRGLSGIERENSCPAFVAAGNRDYFGIETDVHRTSDGKYIIIHDDNTERVAFENVGVEGSTFEKLRSVALRDKDDAHRCDLWLPTLREYLKICKRYDKIGVLEFKNRFDRRDIEEVLGIVKEEYAIEKMVFISFDYENMCNIRDLQPECEAQFLCMCEVDDALIEKIKAQKLDVDIYHERLNREIIAKFHENGIKVNCWTCDDKARAEQLVEWGVDFITTNILQ